MPESPNRPPLFNDPILDLRREFAVRAGLSPTSITDEVYHALSPNDQKDFAARLGLDPQTHSWSDIEQKVIDSERREQALLLGLDPKTSSWEDIHHASSEPTRRRRAADLGLPPDTSSWSDIVEHGSEAAIESIRLRLKDASHFDHDNN